MKKLTAEKCREIIEECRALKERGYLSINGDYKLQALQIALPILEQQEIVGDWIEWGGGERPVSGEKIVEIKMRNGGNDGPKKAGNLSWHNGNAVRDEMGCDIIAYRLVKS